MEQWKSNLAEFFTSKGLFQKEYLEKVLNEVVVDFTSYVSKYQGAFVEKDAKLDSMVNRLGKPITAIRGLTIHLRFTYEEPLPFICTFGFFSEASRYFFRMHWTEGFAGITKDALSASGNNESLYIWKSEEFDEAEITEKAFLLELISLRMRSYFSGCLKVN